MDEARNAIYYLSSILTDAMPEMLTDLSELLGEHGVVLPAHNAPSVSVPGSAETATATRTSPLRSRERSCSCRTSTPSGSASR
ncbi:phosphoenolpyruvate carboxylase [Arthrobacter sp. Hiyo8]|nr:phosphoenolpyruvate carboxylase [Arthrobacter sp. Hiyo8]